MKSFFKSLLIIVFTLAIVAVLYAYWPYIFARTVTGVISDVQRVATPVAVVSGVSNTAARDLFSFAVGIKEPSGEIVTASSEDRQWAVAKPGQCAEAKFYPYPPWEFEKSGTYFGARLMKLHVCDSGQLIQPDTAAAAPEPPAIPTPAPTETGMSQSEAEAAAAAAAAAQSPPAPATTGR